MNSKKYNFVGIAILALLFFNLNATAQVGVGTETPSTNAMLDVESTSKGFLPPRMSTTEKNNLGLALTTAASAADEGMIVYDTDLNSYNVWNGAAWIELAFSTPPSSIGNMYSTGTATTAISMTPVKLNTVTTLLNSTGFDDNGGANNSLRYIGTEVGKVFTVQATLSFAMTVAPAFPNGVTFSITKNGSSSAELGLVITVEHEVPANGFIDLAKLVTITGTVSLDPNDTIEVWVQSSSPFNMITNSLNIVLSE